ncbi:MAG: 2-oxoglutarate dehydrogenase E1 component [candidate division BRC1 bacterium ADurb.BinA364]|nr:MAG: 2-oxoglutarate dehydrogenase E1 component [candidate division BRC1 bacterium ADurb.BinA364]
MAVPSTPAQYFHLLRRQMKRRWIKPLVVMSPKSLLRHPRCVSPLEDFAEGRFRRFLPDEGGPAGRAERVLLCAGKIYYELAEEREKRRRFDVAIVRCQQLYPMSDGCMAAALAPYADGTPVYWVQEEPSNMGAWPHLRARFLDRILDRYPFGGICRPASASPATGSANSHKIEQQRVRDRAFAETRETAKKKKSGAPMAL